MAATTPTLAIFDLDGTLADSFPWFVGMLHDVADEFGFRHLPDDEIEALRRCSAREILSRLKVPLWKLPSIARHMRKLKAQHLHDIHLFPGVREMLLTLSHHNVTLALVSSDNEDNVRRQLGSEIGLLFKHFDCGASLFGKAAKFKRVMKHANVATSATISIGDEIRDIEAARSVGIRCGAVAWGYAEPESLRAQKPDFVFDSMTDILLAFRDPAKVPA